MKIGLTLGCFTPLSFVEESVYYLDRLHLVTHGVGANDNDWLWRKSALPLIRNARKLIEERNPNCELCVDGGVRLDNMDELVREDIDAIVASSAIFNHPDGITAGVKAFRETMDKARADLD